MTSKRLQQVTLNNRTCSWFLKGGHSPKSLGFIFQTLCISSPNFTQSIQHLLRHFPDVSILAWCRRKSLEIIKVSLVSQQNWMEIHQMLVEAFSPIWQKNFFLISAELKDLLLIHCWKIKWMHVQTHIWRLNLSKKWTILLWQINEVTLLELA